MNSATELVDTVNDWGLTVSIVKTKGMVVGADVDQSAVAPQRMENGSIEMVDTFPYLGGSITSDGKVTLEVASRIAKASRAFGCLKKPIFQNPS